MGVKICFYATLFDDDNNEMNLVKYYNTLKDKYYIHRVSAGEVCSEFFARYYHKINQLPELLLDKVIKENYNEEEYKYAVQDMYNGIYKANMNAMKTDNDNSYNFSAYNDCKKVREKLLEIHNEIYNKSKETIKNPKIEMYAILTIA